MNPYISNIAKNPQLSQMMIGTGGLQTGNPWMDMGLSMFLGNTLGPSPGQQQSILDAYHMRERSRDYMALMKTGFGTSLLGQHMAGPGGFNTSGFFGGLVANVAGASGLLDNPFMQSINGGNPVKALMGLKANMTGMTMGQGFGKITEADNATVMAAFKELQNSFFKTRTMTGEDISLFERNRLSKFVSGLSGKDKENLGGYISNNSFDLTRFKDDSDIKIKNFDSELASLSKNFEKNKEQINKLQDEKASYVKEVNRVLSDAGADDIFSFRTRLGEKTIISTNPEKMRGYKLQDLSKAYTMALDLNMTSIAPGNENLSLKDKVRLSAAGFANNAAGTLRAVSDLTGAETADQALAQLNSLFGNSKANLGTESGAREAESLVRRFKSSARAAGIGIDAVMQILNEVKLLSAAHPELRYTGGISSMETSIRALTTTSALSSTMGGDWIRQAGGQANMSNLVTQIHGEASAQPVSMELRGIAGLIANSQLSAQEKTNLMSELSKWSAGSASKLGAAGHAYNNPDKVKMMEAISRMTNGRLSVIDLMVASGSSVAQQAGSKFLGENTQFDLDAAARGPAQYSDLMTLLEGTGRTEAAAGVAEQLKNQHINHKSLSEILTANGFTGTQFASYFTNDPKLEMGVTLGARLQDPAFLRQYEKIKAISEGYAKEEARTAKSRANLQSPFMDTLVQAWLGGAFGKGTDELLGLIGSEPARLRAEEQLKALEENSVLATPESFREVMLQTLGGAKSLDEESVIKNLKLLGITDSAQISDILSQRSAFKDDVGFAAFQKGTSASSLRALSLAAQKLEAGTITAEELKKIGLTEDELASAGTFLNVSGLGARSVLDKYGGYNFNELQKNLPMSRILAQSAQLAYQDSVGSELSLAGSKLKDYYKGEFDAKNPAAQQHLELLINAGYLSKKSSSGAATYDNIDWSNTAGLEKYAKDYNEDISASLHGLLTSEGAAGLKNRYGSLSSEDRSYLQSKGALSIDSSGNATWNDEKLNALTQSRRGLEGMQGKNYILDQLAKDLKDTADKLNSNLQVADQKLAAEQLKEMTTALTSGSKELTSVLNAIQKTLANAIAQ